MWREEVTFKFSCFWLVIGVGNLKICKFFKFSHRRQFVIVNQKIPQGVLAEMIVTAGAFAWLAFGTHLISITQNAGQVCSSMAMREWSTPMNTQPTMSQWVMVFLVTYFFLFLLCFFVSFKYGITLGIRKEIFVLCFFKVQQTITSPPDDQPVQTAPLLFWNSFIQCSATWQKLRKNIPSSRVVASVTSYAGKESVTKIGPKQGDHKDCERYVS